MVSFVKTISVADDVSTNFQNPIISGLLVKALLFVASTNHAKTALVKRSNSKGLNPNG